jgi:hypothetical protein
VIIDLPGWPIALVAVLAATVVVLVVRMGDLTARLDEAARSHRQSQKALEDVRSQCDRIECERRRFECEVRDLRQQLQDRSTAPTPLWPESGFAASGADEAPTIVAPTSDRGSWLRLVEECVGFFDELDQSRHRLDDERLRELVSHVRLRVKEILERSGVDMIDGEQTFDRARHQADAARAPRPGAPITATISPGFAVGKRVLRRARVETVSAR